MWTKSACVVLAWSILTIILVAAGMMRSDRPAQANPRIASNTEITLASTLSVAAASVTAARPAARYLVQPGDTLSGIAARFDVRGGWPALYAANRSLVGPDPNAIRPGTVLAVPGSAAPPPRASSAGRRTYPTSPSAPTSSRRRPPPTRTTAPTAKGIPQWLKAMLLAVALLIGAALLAEPGLAVGRRRRRQAANGPAQLRSGRLASGKPQIVLADHDRLVVTRSTPDDTVYVLRPPGEDPKAILGLARLVLPEDPYEELADQFGVAAGWPLE